MRQRIAPVFVLAVALLGAACDDPFASDPDPTVEGSVTIYSLARPENLGLPAAFDVISGGAVKVENPTATGNWDVALSEEDGRMMLAPAGAFPGISARVGIEMDTTRSFEQIKEASGDTASYRTDEAVPVRMDAVYIIRSRLTRYLTTCHYYAKVKPVAVDTAAGSLRFDYLRNPNCNERALEPPKEE